MPEVTVRYACMRVTYRAYPLEHERCIDRLVQISGALGHVKIDEWHPQSSDIYGSNGSIEHYRSQYLCTPGEMEEVERRKPCEHLCKDIE
jgi:hypothetical protein